MKKIFILLGSMFLLVGCFESFALLGTGAVNGKIVQSSINTGISYGIKSETGKSPLEHAVSYSKNNKPEKKIVSNQVEIKKNKSFYEPPNVIVKSLQSSINKKFKIKYLD